ncbi:12168_t:CDS:10, partial [Ambispora leptoticha]
MIKTRLNSIFKQTVLSSLINHSHLTKSTNTPFFNTVFPSSTKRYFSTCLAHSTLPAFQRRLATSIMKRASSSTATAKKTRVTKKPRTTEVTDEPLKITEIVDAENVSEGEVAIKSRAKKATSKTTKKSTTTAKRAIAKPRKTTTRKTATTTTGKGKKKQVTEQITDENEFIEAVEDTEMEEAFPHGESQSEGEDHAFNQDKAIEDIYQKKTQLEHILLRPDSYIGSVEATTQPLWIFDSETNKLAYKEVKYVPGFYKIIDELLVNAADNKSRDPKMNTIKINVDRANNTISVYNNGRGIPIEIHKTENMYVPELIFGHLLTSSNYDDKEQKTTGGRNGFGAKLANIYSNEFTVETGDKSTKKKYQQVFSKNMSVIGSPEITDLKCEEFTRITFKPDLEKFKLTEIDDDFEALLKKRAYDMAGILPKVNVVFNNEKISIKGFKDYIQLYLDAHSEEGEEVQFIYEAPNERWEIGFAPSDGQFKQVSFVNSICTSRGGTHVEYIANQIINRLADAIKKKTNRKEPIKKQFIKSNIWIFVNCKIVNPSFDSQTKETLTTGQAKFGSTCELSDAFMKKILSSKVIENIASFLSRKDEAALKKTDGHKKSKLNIPKLDDANDAGTKDGKYCTLILTEGDSAKTIVTQGISVVGSDRYGVFPLRGKLLNVRETASSTVVKNVEITNIKQILGLKTGTEYNSVNNLRYGSLMIMTDQDHDGSHIKGLIINFLDHFFPSLLKIPNFLLEFITPIVKGLGTNTKQDAQAYFGDLERHRKPFEPIQDQERDLIDMAFNKKKADERKEWLSKFRPGTFIDHSANTISIENFVNQELILFSMADNARSIPSVVDGLKPGQRKVLYGCFKRNLKGEIKVAQLAGYVAEHSAYHHGETSLVSTIVNLAHDFVGSNNLNLLLPKGTFGSRLMGGKDAAQARYIFTQPSKLLKLVFNSTDHNLVKYLNDDGQNIEPEWYIPILPMVLVNGCSGIGTGWSSDIPNYNPRDIIDNIRRLMNKEEMVPMHPWYRGFKGEIVKENANRYRIHGIINKIDDTTLEILELPIGVWTTNYKESLSKMCDEGFINDYKSYHSSETVCIIVTLSPENMAKAETEGLENTFKLSKSLTTSNMVCFDPEGRLRKYNTDYLLRDLEEQCERLENKYRFVTMIIDGQLEIKNKKHAEVVALLDHHKFRRFENTQKNHAQSSTTSTDDEENEEENDNGLGYDYLLTMPIRSITYERAKKLKEERDQKNEEMNSLRGLSAKDLWNNDLEAFLIEWDKFVEEKEAEAQSEPLITNSSSKAKSRKTSKAASVKNNNSTTQVASVKNNNSATQVASVKNNNSTAQKNIDSYFQKPNNSKSTTASSEETKPLNFDFDYDFDSVDTTTSTKGKEKAVELLPEPAPATKASSKGKSKAVNPPNDEDEEEANKGAIDNGNKKANHAVSAQRNLRQ